MILNITKKMQDEKGDVTFDISYRQAKNIVKKLCQLKLIALDKRKKSS